MHNEWIVLLVKNICLRIIWRIYLIRVIIYFVVCECSLIYFHVFVYQKKESPFCSGVGRLCKNRSSCNDFAAIHMFEKKEVSTGEERRWNPHRWNLYTYLPLMMTAYNFIWIVVKKLHMYTFKTKQIIWFNLKYP